MRKSPAYTLPASRRRRRGQALLLAVLIMIFAALLGATFVAVVSLNLSQTARTSDKTAADLAAKAGVEYVNQQLTYSPDGRNWFNKNFDAAFFSTANADPNYYSSVARAQGWAGTYAVFPDPRQPNPSGTRFMAHVERLGYNLDPSSTAPDSDKPGALKITVIGLSPDDDAVWSRTVAYKGGIEEAPLGQVMHTVSNWDFTTNKVPVGKINTITGSDLSLKDVQGRFPIGNPFYVTITTINPGGTSTVRGALVASASVTPTNTTLTLADLAQVTPAPTANDHIEVAAGVGLPTAIDYDRDTTAELTVPNNRLTDNGATAAYRGNGGLLWFGNTTADQLRPISQSFGAGTAVPGFIRTSGVIALNTGATVSIQGSNMGAAGTLLDSGQTGFPSTEPGAEKVVEDGFNRIVGDEAAQTRDVSAFTPPNFSSDKALERYRRLTKFSTPIAATDVIPTLPGTITDASAIYGYGRGIYIDNAEDREQTLSGTVRRDMSQGELQSLWFDQSNTTSTLPFLRLRPASDPNANSAFSLEDTHRRGWITQDEFLPRGVQIELVEVAGTPKSYYIDVTRDPRQDNTAAQPAASVDDTDGKAWKDADGDVQPGIYHKRFNWPVNGILFAEGNVRIRGTVTDPPTSLTVISMNNMYIEGPTKVEYTPGSPARKLLLLAKRNVVVNPTQLLGRPDDHTLATTGSVTMNLGTTTTLTVASVESIKIGDCLEVADEDAGAEKVGGVILVTAVDTGTSQITGTIVKGDAATYASPFILRDAKDTASDSQISTISNTTTGIQRRLVKLPITHNLALSLVHGAERRVAYRIGTVPGTLGKPTGTNIYLGNKLTFDATPIVSGVNPVPQSPLTTSDFKRLTGKYDFPSTGIDVLPNSGPADNPTANAYTLTQLASDANLLPVRGDASFDWKYDSTALGGYNAVPFFYLAGVGNRHQWNYSSGPIEWRKDILTTDYEVPLATSVQFLLDGISTPTDSDNVLFDLQGANPTKQFGFDPLFLGSAPAQEDALTTDQTFYDSTPASATTTQVFTLDSRRLPAFTSTTTTVDLSLQAPQGLIGLTSTATLPTYRLAYMKPEDIEATATTLEVAPLNFEIHAFVYAQEGSWTILPTPKPVLDSRLKGNQTQSYYNANDDTDADPGEYLDLDNSSTYTPGDHADLNRDGASTPDEVYWLQRYFRPNYQITFTGTIMENTTVPVLTAGAIPGAVSEWTDSLTTTTIDSATATPVTTDRIKYNFDPDLVTGLMDPVTGTPPVGFYLPETPKITYQS